MSKSVIVFEVLYDAASEEGRASFTGNCGDGTAIFRTRSREEAERFASTHQAAYGPGRPKVQSTEVGLKLALRWGV